MTVVINGTTGISGVDGSAGTPAVQGSDTNTGVFYPAADTVAISTGGSERMRVDSSGNVGVGTTAPSCRLNPTCSGTGTQEIIAFGMSNSTSGYSNYARIRVGAENSTTGSEKGNLHFDAKYLGTYEEFLSYVTQDRRLVFSTAGSERARIDPSGNLLVGTTSTIGSATGVLQVKGAASQNAMQVQIGTNGNNGILWYNASASAIGSIVVNSGSVAYNTSSDYRMKENIAPMTGALAKVSALKPCTYTWKATGEHTQGFIAHELQEVVPDCVTGKKDAVDADGNPIYQGIDTSFLIATLTAAIQEQQALITALTARITALEAK